MKPTLPLKLGEFSGGTENRVEKYHLLQLQKRLKGEKNTRGNNPSSGIPLLLMVQKSQTTSHQSIDSLSHYFTGLYISAGAGFQPSTVLTFTFHCYLRTGWTATKHLFGVFRRFRSISMHIRLTPSTLRRFLDAHQESYPQNFRVRWYLEDHPI